MVALALRCRKALCLFRWICGQNQSTNSKGIYLSIKHMKAEVNRRDIAKQKICLMFQSTCGTCTCTIIVGTSVQYDDYQDI